MRAERVLHERREAGVNVRQWSRACKGAAPDAEGDLGPHGSGVVVAKLPDRRHTDVGAIPSVAVLEGVDGLRGVRHWDPLHDLIRAGHLCRDHVPGALSYAAQLLLLLRPDDWAASTSPATTAELVQDRRLDQRRAGLAVFEILVRLVNQLGEHGSGAGDGG